MIVIIIYRAHRTSIITISPLLVSRSRLHIPAWNCSNWTHHILHCAQKIQPRLARPSTVHQIPSISSAHRAKAPTTVKNSLRHRRMTRVAIENSMNLFSSRTSGDGKHICEETHTHCRTHIPTATYTHNRDLPSSLLLLFLFFPFTFAFIPIHLVSPNFRERMGDTFLIIPIVFSFFSRWAMGREIWRHRLSMSMFVSGLVRS